MNMWVAARTTLTTERPLGPVGLAGSAAVVATAAVVAAAMPDGPAARWFLAAVIAAVLGFVCARSTTQGVFATFAWLVALGLTRRLTSEVLADPRRDPLLLVGSAAVAVLTVRAVGAGALRRRTILAYALLVFSALAVIELLNPDQPGGLTRVAGLLVWVVPTLWFWVGRSVIGDRLAFRLLVAAGGATLLVAVYGIAQTLVGFPPWDRHWINLRGYPTLYIGPNTVRPFGTYASAAEFALACAIGATLAATAFFGPRLLLSDTGRHSARRRVVEIAVLALGAFLIAVLALVLSAVRTSLVLLVVAVPVLYLVMKGKRAWVVLVPALALAAFAVAAISRVNPDDLGRTGASAGIRRIIVAVHDPFASNASNTDNTLQLHYDNARHGIEEAFRRPLGQGTGSTGLAGTAGDNFSTKSRSTDFDISDAGVAFGIPGLLATLGFCVLAFVTAVRVALRRRTFERVALVGIMIVSIGAWWQGAYYAMAPLLWLLIGRADGMTASGQDAEHPDEAPDSSGPDLRAGMPAAAP